MKATQADKARAQVLFALAEDLETRAHLLMAGKAGDMRPNLYKMVRDLITNVALTQTAGNQSAAALLVACDRKQLVRTWAGLPRMAQRAMKRVFERAKAA